MGPLTWVLDVGQRAACGSSDVPTVHKSNPPIKMDRSKSKDAGGALLVLPHSSLAAGQVFLDKTGCWHAGGLTVFLSGLKEHGHPYIGKPEA